MESIHSNYHSHCFHNRLRTLSPALSCLWSLSLFLSLFPHIPFFFFTCKMCNIINVVPLLYFTQHSVNILWNMMFHRLLAACGSFTGRCRLPFSAVPAIRGPAVWMCPRLPLSELRQAAGHLPISPSANPQPSHTSISEANAEASTKIMSADNEASSLWRA